MFKRIHFVVAAAVVYAALISAFIALNEGRLNGIYKSESINLRFCCSSQKCGSKFINETFSQYVKESTGEALEYEVQAHYERPKCILRPLDNGQRWELVYVRCWR
jgi:hypothetical protein